jgi:hypothetical protein
VNIRPQLFFVECSILTRLHMRQDFRFTDRLVANNLYRFDKLAGMQATHPRSTCFPNAVTKFGIFESGGSSLSGTWSTATAGAHLSYRGNWTNPNRANAKQEQDGGFLPLC